jgi:signal transduction histidine kinase
MGLMRDIHRRPVLFALIIFAFWTSIALLHIGHEVVWFTEAEGRLPVPRLLAVHAVEWWSWALMTPVIYLFVRRVPVESLSWPRVLAMYGAAAVIALLLNAAIVAIGWMWFPWHEQAFAATFGAQLKRLLSYDVLLFFWLAFALHGVIYYYTARERAVEAARLRAQLAAARLNVLTMQLQPHFFFNTLNTISGLVTIEPRAAERMISRLADLLRLSLRTDRGALVPLQEELTFLATYLEIQKARFDERLNVQFEFDAGVELALVPTFLLQPLVENTIRHAVAPYSEPVRITVSARRSGERLEIIVRDDGPGLPVDDPRELSEGVGLHNTRVRLRELYGANHRFLIACRPLGGVEVLIDLPWSQRGPAVSVTNRVAPAV